MTENFSSGTRGASQPPGFGANGQSREAVPSPFSVTALPRPRLLAPVFTPLPHRGLASVTACAPRGQRRGTHGVSWARGVPRTRDLPGSRRRSCCPTKVSAAENRRGRMAGADGRREAGVWARGRNGPEPAFPAPSPCASAPGPRGSGRPAGLPPPRRTQGPGPFAHAGTPRSPGPEEARGGAPAAQTPARPPAPPLRAAAQPGAGRNTALPALAGGPGGAPRGTGGPARRLLPGRSGRPGRRRTSGAPPSRGAERREFSREPRGRARVNPGAGSLLLSGRRRAEGAEPGRRSGAQRKARGKVEHVPGNQVLRQRPCPF